MDLVRELEDLRAGFERGNNADGPYFVDLLGRAISAIKAAEALQRRLDAMTAPTEHEAYRAALRQALDAAQSPR